MAQSMEIRLLRRENTRLGAEFEDIKGRSERDIAKLHEIVAEMAAEMASLRGRLAACDNACTSPPGGIRGTGKRATARDGGPAGSGCTQKGHKRALHGRRSGGKRTRRAGR